MARTRLFLIVLDCLKYGEKNEADEHHHAKAKTAHPSGPLHLLCYFRFFV